jgi:hypothetical protein
MIDNNDTIVDSNFVRNMEEKSNLMLYSAFSKKSRNAFLNENSVKMKKAQNFIRRILNIYIPYFEVDKKFQKQIQNLKDNPINIDSENSANKQDNLLFNKKIKMFNDYIKTKKLIFSTYLKYNMEKNENKNNLKNEVLIDNEIEKKSDYSKIYNKYLHSNFLGPSYKGYFHMPQLENISNENMMNFQNVSDLTNDNNKNKKKYTSLKQKENQIKNKFNDLYQDLMDLNNKYWNPEIDSEFLSYLNHNFVSIDNIYNNKQKNNVVIDNSDIILAPIKSSEIIPVAKTNIKINQEEVKKPINKLADFNEIKSRVEFIDYKSDEEKIRLNKKNETLKKEFYKKIDEICDFNDMIFPIGKDIPLEKIYRFARNNEKGEISSECFSIEKTKKEKIKRYEEKLKVEIFEKDQNNDNYENEIKSGSNFNNEPKLDQDKILNLSSNSFD